jgi:hypothetical protein
MNFRRKKDSFRCVASPTKACGGARTADHDKPAENLAREARPARWPDALTAQSGARTRVSRCCVLGQVGIHAAEVSSSGSGYAKPVALAAAHVFALVCAFVVWWPMRDGSSADPVPTVSWRPQEKAATAAAMTAHAREPEDKRSRAAMRCSVDLPVGLWPVLFLARLAKDVAPWRG